MTSDNSSFTSAFIHPTSSPSVVNLAVNIQDRQTTGSMDPEKRLHTIDENVASLLSRPWKATLRFKGFLCQKNIALVPDECILQDSDLFEFTKRTWRGCIFRFDPAKYPVVPGGFSSNKDSYKCLVTDMMTTSQQNHNCTLTSNGSRGKGHQRQVACTNLRRYREPKYKKAGGELRQSSLTCDRKNSRGRSGQRMAKRTSTARPTEDEITCKAKLVVGIDNFSLFLVCGSGYDMHEGHPPLSTEEMTTRKRLVPAEAASFQERAAIANVRPGQTAALVHLMCGLHLTRRQVAYSQAMASLCNTMMDESEKAEFQQMNDTERVFNYLKKNDASYVALYHRKGSSEAELPPGHTNKKAKSSVCDPSNYSGSTTDDFLWTESIGNTSENMVIGADDGFGVDMIGYARSSREAINASDDQDVLIALAWMLPSGKRFFQAFPEVLFIDGTHKTNKEGRVLFTVGLKDMNGNVAVVLRVWAPNERSWMFRWMFQSAIPTLIGKEACGRVHLIITDGDSQEFTQLDDAIRVIFTNAKRRRCGWHIVKNFEDGFRVGRDELQKKIVDLVKNWLYSLMKDVETEDEYKISKALLLAYIKSNRVASILGANKSDQLVTYLRNKLFPNEQFYARCHYLYIRGFDSYSNTVLEGTNFGVKYCENGVRPNMSSAKSTKVMIDQDRDKATITAKRTTDAFLKTPLYTKTATSTNIVQVAESHLQNEMAEVENYASLRMKENEFWVVRSTPVPQTAKNSIIPIFRRLRVVTVNRDGRLQCNCGSTHRYGIPDRHIGHSSEKFGKDFRSFTHHDIDPRFWTSYCKFVAVDDPAQIDEQKLDLRTELQQARREMSGFPRAPTFLDMNGFTYAVGTKSDKMFFEFTPEQAKQHFESLKAKGSIVLNYTEKDVEVALNAEYNVCHAEGMTQETYNCESDDQSISFPDPESGGERVTNNFRLSSYERFKPMFKEVISLLEGVDEALENEIASTFEGMINKLKQVHIANLPPSTGNIVSCMPINLQSKSRHTKQKQY